MVKELKITYGEINQKNINQLRRLNFDVFPVKYSTGFYVKLIMEYTQLSSMAYYNDILIGAYTVRIQKYKQQTAAYILTFGVLEPYRKYKIGSQMMQRLQKQVRDLKNVECIYLHMHVINEIGRKFYEKCGFKIDTKLENYYTDLQEPHCYILKKDLL